MPYTRADRLIMTQNVFVVHVRVYTSRLFLTAECQLQIFQHGERSSSFSPQGARFLTDDVTEETGDLINTWRHRLLAETHLTM